MRRRLLFTVLFALCVTTSLPNVHSQTDVQYRVDSLIIGISDLDQVVQIYGEPESQKKQAELYEGWREGKLEGLYMGRTLNLEWLKEDVQKGEISVGGKRTVYDLEYPKQGVTVTMLDNPWRVNAISITNKDVEVNGIRVGDGLKDVVKRLGKGAWFTTDVEDGWWAEYEDEGVRYFFKADSKAPKYPMKLAQEKVVIKIERYDSKISFS